MAMTWVEPDPGDEDDTRAARTHVEEAADQLRTYRPGDALRSIAWKHSARLERVGVRFPRTGGAAGL